MGVIDRAESLVNTGFVKDQHETSEPTVLLQPKVSRIQGFNNNDVTEEQHNPRLQFANKKSYADFMMNLQLPNPKLMDIAVPANQSCGKISDE